MYAVIEEANYIYRGHKPPTKIDPRRIGERDLFGNESENLSVALWRDRVLSTLGGRCRNGEKLQRSLHAARAWLMLARSAIRLQTCG